MVCHTMSGNRIRPWTGSTYSLVSQSATVGFIESLDESDDVDVLDESVDVDVLDESVDGEYGFVLVAAVGLGILKSGHSVDASV